MAREFEPKEAIPENSNLFFVPGSELERKYLAEQRIILKRLDNGTSVVGYSRESKYDDTAAIRFIFPNGSEHDPVGREGLHHLLEHLWNKGLPLSAIRTKTWQNASTSQRSMEEILAGPYLTKDRAYGINPMITPVISALRNPLRHFPNPDNIVEAEKIIILNEMAGLEVDPHHLRERHVLSTIFAEDNPINLPIIGTPESLADILPEDVYKLASKIPTTRGTVIELISESGRKSAFELVNILAKKWGDYEKTDSPFGEFDPEDEEKINPNFKPATQYEQNTGLGNGRVDVTLAWVVNVPQHTPQHTAWRNIRSAVTDKLMWERRSYSQTVELFTPGNRMHAFCITFAGVESGDIDEDQVQQALWFSLKDLKKIGGANAKRYTNGRGITFEDRNELTTEMLRSTGRVINIPQLLEVNGSVEIKHLREAIEFLGDTPPAIIVTGDLG